jgi:hypothetical protein
MRRILFLGLLLPLLSACGPGSESADHAAATTPAPVATPATSPAVTARPAKPAGPIWFEPSALSTCGKSQKVTVAWNVRKLPDVKQVNIMAVKKDGTEVLFATGGFRGSRETGPWMRGGSAMILRATGTGAELGRATIDPLPCGK